MRRQSFIDDGLKAGWMTALDAVKNIKFEIFSIEEIL